MICGGTTGDLYQLNIKSIDPVNRCLVEWRGHRDHTCAAYFLGENAEIRFVQASREEAGDMLVVAVLVMRRMNKCVQITELKLERGAHTAALRNLPAFANYASRVFEIALMVVGQVEDEQVVEVI